MEKWNKVELFIFTLLTTLLHGGGDKRNMGKYNNKVELFIFTLAFWIIFYGVVSGLAAVLRISQGGPGHMGSDALFKMSIFAGFVWGAIVALPCYIVSKRIPKSKKMFAIRAVGVSCIMNSLIVFLSLSLNWSVPPDYEAVVSFVIGFFTPLIIVGIIGGLLFYKLVPKPYNFQSLGNKQKNKQINR